MECFILALQRMKWVFLLVLRAFWSLSGEGGSALSTPDISWGFTWVLSHTLRRNWAWFQLDRGFLQNPTDSNCHFVDLGLVMFCGCQLHNTFWCCSLGFPTLIWEGTYWLRRRLPYRSPDHISRLAQVGQKSVPFSKHPKSSNNQSSNYQQKIIERNQFEIKLLCPNPITVWRQSWPWSQGNVNCVWLLVMVSNTLQRIQNSNAKMQDRYGWVGKEDGPYQSNPCLLLRSSLSQR